MKRREPNLPYGYVTREVRTVPRIALTVSPMTAVVPLSSPTRTVDLDVTVMHNASAPTNGQLALTLPSGWTSTPAQHAFTFQRAGERAHLSLHDRGEDDRYAVARRRRGRDR